MTQVDIQEPVTEKLDETLSSVTAALGRIASVETPEELAGLAAPANVWANVACLLVQARNAYHGGAPIELPQPDTSEQDGLIERVLQLADQGASPTRIGALIREHMT